MTWTAADRHTFADLIARQDEQPHDVLEFLAERRAAVVDEAGADPGIDQVRAGILRALREAGDPMYGPCREAAIPVLRAFPQQVQGASPALLQRRHPAWVGLAALEAGMELDDALALARVGFETFAGPQGEGDVLWALAEAAEDVGWAARHEALLRAAVNAEFLDRSQHDQVRLLWALHRIDVPDAPAHDELEALADEVDADVRSRIHALWVLAARYRDADDAASSRRALLAALALVDKDEEPETAARLRQALEA